MATERPAETAPFGGVGREREIEAHDQSFENNQEGEVLYSFPHTTASDGVAPCSARRSGQLPAEYEDGLTRTRRDEVTRFGTGTTEFEVSRKHGGA